MKTSRIYRLIACIALATGSGAGYRASGGDPEPSWTTVTNSMSVPRMNHTGTLLDPALDARHIALVLLAGGRTAGGATTRTADLYDPFTNTFSPTGSMACARELHTATLLADGRVLVVGGLTSGDGLPGGLPDVACSVAEVYDPSSGVWTAVSPTGAPPTWGHAASRIEAGAQAGKVLVSGGRIGPKSKPTSTVSLFDPATNNFQVVPSIPASRYLHGQVSERGGALVLVAGGKCPDCTSLNTAFEADTNRSNPTRIEWTSTGSTLLRDEGPVLVRVFGNQALIVGGGNGGAASNLSQLHAFGQQPFTDDSTMSVSRSAHRGAVLSDGRVIIAGGRDGAGRALESAEIWHPTTNTWSADPDEIGPMSVPRASHSLTGLQGGKVLAAGGAGSGGEVLAAAEVFPFPPMPCHGDVDCGEGSECIGDICVLEPCAPGLADCNASLDDGCETNLDGDPENCGGCAVSCDDGQSCTADTCAAGACTHVDQRACLAAPTTGEGEVACATGLAAPGCWGTSCGAESNLVVLVPGCEQPDSDGDGLPDRWEQDHAVDGNCDGDFADTGQGGTDVLLPDDADWDEVTQKNAYVAYDWMAKDPSNPDEAQHEPQADFEGLDSLGNPAGTVGGTLTRVTEAFERRGIRLKIHSNTRIDPLTSMEITTSPLQHREVVTFADPPGDCATNSGAHTAVSFYELKRQNFEPRLKFTHKYAVFGHKLQCSGNCASDACVTEAADLGMCGAVAESTSGLGELHGNDMVVTLGGFGLDDGSAVEEPLRTAMRDRLARFQAGTLMHELGHTVGLDHGGPSDSPGTCSPPGPSATNRKPNYISVMNQALQLTGIRTAETNCSTTPLLPDPPYAQLPGLEGDWRVDYSSSALPALDENALNESDGISSCVCGQTDGLRDISLAFKDCDPGVVPVPGCGPVDWNRVDGPSGIVSVDLNQDSLDQDDATCPAHGTLEGFDDWSFVRRHLAFQCGANFQDGTPPAPPYPSSSEPDAHTLEPMGLIALVVNVVVQPGHPAPVITLGETFHAAVLGSSTLDVMEIVPSSLRFAGASTVSHQIEDVDGDGNGDLIVLFNASDTSLSLTSTTATLSGTLVSTRSIRGSASFTVTSGTACNPGFDDCDGDPANGCEANLDQDPANCGACGTSCDDGSICTNDICSNGICQFVDRNRCANPDPTNTNPMDPARCGPSGCGVCGFLNSYPGCDNPDTDGDGLGDVWEDAQAIDLDCDGDYDSNDVQIPGASKYVADIYVKAGAMEASTGANPCLLSVPCPQGFGCDAAAEFCLDEPADLHVPTENAVRDVVAMFGGSHLRSRPMPCDAATPCTAAGFTCSTEDFVCLPTCVTDGDCAGASDGARCVDGLCRRRRLHFDHAEITLIPHTTVITFGPPNPACITDGDLGQAVNFFDVKADPASFDPKSALFTHYGIFGHFQSCDSAATCGTFGTPGGCALDISGSPPNYANTGLAEVIGNDWVVTLGALGTPTSPALKDARDSGALAHELGHNLGLRHGGPDCLALQPAEPCDYSPGQDEKSNYLSIMNSTYQFGIPTLASGRMGFALDYSRGVLGPLDESSLDEASGVFPGLLPPWDTYLVKFFSSGLSKFGSVAPGDPIDWNDNTLIDAVPVSVDINDSGSMEVMRGAEDWNHLFYPFQCSEHFKD